MTNRLGLAALVLLLEAAPALAQSPQACDGLRSLALANTVVTTAAVVSGSFTPPGATNANATIRNLPAFCRVAVTLKPTADSEIIDATDANLQPFFARGGKVLLYHGWNDQLVAPMNSVNYYQSVVAATKSATDSIRLFMMPGMTHCRGGVGPDNFDRMDVIERWVEKGEAPKQIIAEHMSNGVVDRRRPLCPHPQVATYRGTGSLDDAANYTCK